MADPTHHVFETHRTKLLDADEAGTFCALRFQETIRQTFDDIYPHDVTWTITPPDVVPAVNDTLEFRLVTGAALKQFTVVDTIRQVRPGFPDQKWTLVFVIPTPEPTATPNH